MIVLTSNGSLNTKKIESVSPAITTQPNDSIISLALNQSHLPIEVIASATGFR